MKTIKSEDNEENAMEKIIDPWGAALPENYERIIKDFGLQAYQDTFPEPNRLMRRGVVFAGRDMNVIRDCIVNKKPFYVLSGIMPSSEKVHFGTKMVIENIKYFQEHNGHAYVCIADLEAAATRGVSLEEARKTALNFHIPAYVALGLNPKKTSFYFQSENKLVMNLAYVFAKKITLNEFEAIYGSADPSRIMSSVLQAGDILFPQLERKIPGIIPVGVDQDPHIRLARDIVSRTKSTHKFIPPASVYHKFAPSLDGTLKMSKSNPDSMIELPEDIKSACKKIKKALTGGRDTLEEHRRLGPVMERDMVFELLKQHLVEDDDELNKIYTEYSMGKMTSGEIKEIACLKLTEFMQHFTEGLEKARKNIDELHFLK